MKKILIIDDDPIVSTVYQRMLEREGFATALACNGAQGLDRVLSFEPDAVLLDLLMPKVNGFIVLKTIRSAFFGLPVIVITSSCTPEFKDKALAAGASCVFDKSTAAPTDIVDLLKLAIDGISVNRVNAFDSANSRPRFSKEPAAPDSL